MSFDSLSDAHKLRVNAQILGMFESNPEFVVNLQRAVTGTVQHQGLAGRDQKIAAGRDAFQDILNQMRDDLAKGAAQLPALRSSNVRADLEATYSVFRQYKERIGAEGGTESYYTPKEHATLAAQFFEGQKSNGDELRPSEIKPAPIAMLKQIQEKTGYVSPADQKKLTDQGYVEALKKAGYGAPSEEALAAAKRIHTQLPDTVEAMAIDKALAAYRMDNLQARFINAFPGSLSTRTDVSWSKSGLAEAKHITALDAVRETLTTAGFPVAPDRNHMQTVDTSDTVTQLTNLARQVSQDTGRG